jgi:tellurite methyltransferase
MDLKGWEERYHFAVQPIAGVDDAPTPLVIETMGQLEPRPLRRGNVLDLACGTGRNALWLAKRGFFVTAIDGAPTAIQILRHRARNQGLDVHAQVADLEKGEYRIAPSTWDLIAICYYMQRDLLESARQGVRPGGLVLAIVRINQPDEKTDDNRLEPGELKSFYPGWEILHDYEGASSDPAHKHAVAEFVARRPL